MKTPLTELDVPSVPINTAQVEAINNRNVFYVKIATGGERFWCVVNLVTRTNYIVSVDNELVCSEVHGLQYGDVLMIESKHIFDISN